VLDIPFETIGTISLEPGDVVHVRQVPDRVRGRVVVKGHVWQPDVLSIGTGLSLSQALRRAGGLKPDAYLGSVLISRLRADSTRVQLRAEVRDTTGAVATDIALQEDDEVTVFSRTEFRPARYVAIAGMVRSGGRYPWREGMRLRDLVLLAGGLTEGVATDAVEVARRPEVLAPGELAKTIKVSIDSSYLFDEGAVRKSAEEVPLQPYDNVLIFRRPDWEETRQVSITGEVQFPGTYTLRTKDETLADLVRRAGGLTRYASVDGAFFTRARSGTTFASRDASRVRVGVDLARALRDPKSNENLTLQSGDAIDVPAIRETVDLQGELNSPSATTVVNGKPLGYYIRAGGGPTVKADAKLAYVIQPNGKVETRRRLLWVITLDPTPRAGSTVVVPTKDLEKTTSNLMTNITTTAQLLASLAAVWAITR